MKTRHFEHAFLVNAPLHEVIDFHTRAENLRLLTPTVLMMKFEEMPHQLREGSKMSFRVGVWPFSVRWVAQIDQITSHGFVDKQLIGPFVKWVHRHDFAEAGADSTQIIDRIEAELSSRVKDFFVGFLMWYSLPLLFLFRSWTTKKAMEKK